MMMVRLLKIIEYDYRDSMYVMQKGIGVYSNE